MAWGKCKAGKQERSKCGESTGCETEQRACGGALLPGQWSLWGRCTDGFRSRQKCNGEGLDCFYEDEECANDNDSEWSAWTKCKAGLQEREKCGEEECELEVHQCEGKVSWSDWSLCSEGQGQFLNEQDGRCDSSGPWTEEIIESGSMEWDIRDSEYSAVQRGQIGWQGVGGWDVFVL